MKRVRFSVRLIDIKLNPDLFSLSLSIFFVLPTAEKFAIEVLQRRGERTDTRGKKLIKENIF